MFRHLTLFWLLLATISPCLGISTLAFNGSIIADGFLPGLSPKLPQLDKLILDTCSYIMDASHNLKIFLPLTRLNKLQLQFDSFCNVNYHFAERLLYSIPIPVNVAVSQIGRYILKIETESTTLGILKEENKTVETQQFAGIQHGTKDNFLIWINCLDLK